MLDTALSETLVRSHRMLNTAPLRASFLPRIAQASRRLFVYRELENINLSAGCKLENSNPFVFRNSVQKAGK